MAKRKPAKKVASAKKATAGKKASRKSSRRPVKLQRIRMLTASGVVCECVEQSEENFDVTVTAEIVSPAGGHTDQAEATLKDAGGNTIATEYLQPAGGNNWSHTFQGLAECPATVDVEVVFTVTQQFTAACSCTNC